MDRHSTTSTEIIQCARQLIVAGGYNGFSYSDIAKQVGIRNASIHHHFPTKADLVKSLVAQYRQEAAAGLQYLEQNVLDPVERLRAYTDYWKTCIVDASAPICICALLASQIPILPEEVAVEVKAHFENLSAWLEKVFGSGAANGKCKLGGNLGSEAEAFMATIHGAMLSARAYGDSGAFGKIAESALERLTQIRK